MSVVRIRWKTHQWRNCGNKYLAYSWAGKGELTTSPSRVSTGERKYIHWHHVLNAPSRRNRVTFSRNFTYHTFSCNFTYHTFFCVFDLCVCVMFPCLWFFSIYVSLWVIFPIERYFSVMILNQCFSASHVPILPFQLSFPSNLPLYIKSLPRKRFSSSYIVKKKHEFPPLRLEIVSPGSHLLDRWKKCFILWSEVGCLDKRTSPTNEVSTDSQIRGAILVVLFTFFFAEVKRSTGNKRLIYKLSTSFVKF